MIYIIIAGYFEDDASDELTNAPVFKAVLERFSAINFDCSLFILSANSAICKMKSIISLREIKISSFLSNSCGSKPLRQ